MNWSMVPSLSSLRGHDAVDAHVVLRLGPAEKTKHQAAIGVAHGLALGAVAQVGVDAAGKDLLEALVAAVVGVDVGVWQDGRDELVLHGTGGAGDALARKAIHARDGVATQGEHADERLVVAAGEVIALLALGIRGHGHREGGVARLNGGQCGGELLRLEVVRKAKTLGHLVRNGNVKAHDLLGAVGLHLDVAIGREGVIAHEAKVPSREICCRGRG